MAVGLTSGGAQSVYPDILTTAEVQGGLEVKLDVAIELERERVFELVSNITNHSSSSSSSSDNIRLELSHLPPLLLTVLLPPEYPTNADPIVRSIHARHAWLAPNLVNRLGARLEERWRGIVKNGTRDEGILWPWVEDIRTGGFLDSLGSASAFASSSSSSSTSTSTATRPVTLPHPSPKVLYAHLAANQSAAKQAQFSAQAFTCGICLAPQRGARCVQLPCARTHVFCLECLQSFWGLCVSEGEVGKVACPGVECVREREKAKGEETEDAMSGAEWEDVVRRVLSEEQVKRWKWLRIKQAAEKDPHTVPCPVRTCQAPVMRPKTAAEDSESGWARLRTCDSCGHGPVTRCAVTRTVEFMETYIALAEGDPRRRALEMQYGKKNLERMAAEYVQEKENEAWLKERTMACPGCSTNVEKSHGCNHMTCARCAVHFCYRCGTKLRAESPYKHFEQPGSCCGKLFDYDPATWEPAEGDLLRLAFE
ncbi:E3 ubiquitin-protein ligase RNF14 [Ceratobasidium sp. AG-Ba]|nr:E3 ubiquitin-protein ligase RNF14 [Ceratobasidium sp. AG-Ba]